MAVVQVSTTKRFIGTSGDPKPAATGSVFGTVSEGSEFWESDTGRTWRFDGKIWHHPGDPDVTRLLTRLDELISLLLLNAEVAQ